ncbi:non-ribosomal peptide synthetase [Limnohabitans sp. 2KL-17]|uniref:non-ribosomal peptide synthetase n=1 Tax=Limnohabitans sp. 2KL-17 TaxID=1100704 RepID=UPI0011B25B2C|nr:non-ribosomal peptide synthetase [Limnohabitans sp. 2KL-17]
MKHPTNAPIADRTDLDSEQPLVYEFEASFAQQRLWFLDQLAAGSPFYHLPIVIRLRGDLDVALLRACLETVLQRHEALRTTFCQGPDGVLQLVQAEGRLAWTQRQLARDGLDGAELERIALQEAVREGRRPFDLEHGPLLRSCLLALDDGHWMLCVSMHHIVSDGWSLGVFVRELGALYCAGRAGLPLQLPELPLQYPDYSHWQREWMSGAARDLQLAYWREVLQDAPASLALPTDHPRSQRQSFRGDLLPLAFDAGLTQALRTLAARTGSSLFMVTLAAYQVFLWRHSGQRDLCVGVPVANRTRVELEGLIGCFINTVVMRARIDPARSFVQLLAQVKDTALGAFAHQDLPFEQIVEAVHPERDLSHSPLFQAMFMLQNMPMDAFELPGVACQPVELDIGTSKFDLTLSLTERDERLEGYLEYSADLFHRDTVARMAARLGRLLGELVAAPDRPLVDVDWIPPEERTRVVRTWNDSARPLPSGATLLGWLEQRFADAPKDIAVDDGTAKGRLSYAELAARTSVLAHRLRAAGVEPDVRVGVCLERSSDLVVALVAVLRAGGAYVPLDPAYPPQRLAWVLQDAAPLVTLATASTRSRLPLSGHGTLIDPWQDSPPHAEQPLPLATIRAGHLAYVLYTSGSTGRPKGVAISHGALANLLAAMGEVPGCAPGEGVLALTSVSFDISALELFLPLSRGGRIVMISSEDVTDPLRIAERVCAGDVRLLQATPANWRMLLDSGWTPPRAARCLCGGEALPRETAARLVADGARLWNVYGPTETTIWSAISAVDPDDADANVPIGAPLWNTRLHVLDERLVEQPVGVWGELYIAGDGLARGYLNRPDLTAERFLPEVNGAAGQRMYRTGDLVRWRADGQLEFLGRTDHQIKLRGYRIELGEVEAVLGALPDVREAVVVVRDDLPGGRQLVGYAALHEGAQTDEDALRTALRERLPDYMVPSRCLLLQALPLTPNGKVDRGALPVPQQLEADARVAPRTPLETRLAAIWAQVLGVAEVGIEDDFFALGGHSLLATRVMSQVRASCEVQLALRVLFEAPTVAALAKRVEQALREQSVTLPPIEPVRREPGRALALSHAQQRLWFLAQLEPESPAYNMPVVLELRGRLDLRAFQYTLERVVARHEVLRTRFETVDGEPVQVVQAPGAVALAVHEVDGDAAADDWARREAMRPFDLASGPLLRTVLLRLAPQRHVLLLTLHHILADGWSMGVLVRELGLLYTEECGGPAAELAPLSVQYADYAHWQRQVLGPTLERQLEHWRVQLREAPTLTTLPGDRPRPAVRDEAGAAVDRVLPAALRAALERRAQEGQATLFMVLAASFSALLARWAGQQDVCVGTPIANRHRLETESLVGFFVNTLVLRTRVHGHERFAELLARTRETLLQAYAHQDLPFEQLVEALHPERHRSHTPLFQVMLVLQNVPMAALALPGLELVARAPTARTAKFDLTLTLHEAANGTLRADFEYASALFDRATIERLAAHFERLLEQVARDGEHVVGDLELLGVAERAQIARWNDTGRPPQSTPTVHALVQAQVRRTPQAVALRFAQQAWTYDELERRANRLAHELRARGCGPGTRVGICLPRSGELVAALLAVLECGGAYVPLDAALPRARLATILEDARVAFVLGRRDHAPAGLAAPWLHLDDLGHDDPAWCTSPLPAVSGASSDPEVYVLYTSGSTGRPKGVSLATRSLVNLLQWQIEAHGPGSAGPGRNTLQFASLNFDVSFQEIFSTLAAGGTLVLVEDALREDLDQLHEFILAADLQRVFLPNAVLQHFAHLVSNEATPGAAGATGCDIITAGEALHVGEGLRQLIRRLGTRRVFNQYGPTETHVVSEHCLDVATLAHWPATPPIGAPLWNTRLHVLDERLVEQPVGVWGELYIAGDGLARGYLNRPDLTAERFLPEVNGAAGQRMYRTGDLVRWRADGQLEFLGRTDHQIKLRGYRIELGEVEAVLGALPDVREAVVVVRDDLPGGRQLVGYAALHEGAQTDEDALRTALRERLPDYMVPSRCLLLQALPLTPNGKVDRGALPVPQQLEADARVAPRTPLETRLAAIWAQVLGVAEVGIEDDFFALGGHSLLATRVMSQVRASCEVQLALRVLFEAPTVAALAKRVEQALREQGAQKLPSITPVVRASGQKLALSFAQQRLWFLDQYSPDNPFYNIPLALALHGPLQADIMRQAFNELVRRHETLRTVFRVEAGQPHQIILPELELELGQQDLGGQDGLQQRLQLIVRDEASRPFELSRGPLIRASLIRLEAQEHVLLLTLHHIVGDGWSMGVLFTELAQLYQACLQRQKPALPALPIQYADYAAWQRERLSGEHLQTLLRYWKQQLSGAPALLELPTDRPRPAVQTHRGASLDFELDEALTGRLTALANAQGATLFMVLQAAFKVLLSRTCRQDDICVGTPIAGRNRAELEGLIGFFVNTLVLRDHIDAQISFEQLLVRIKETALQAYAHQELPFEQLVEELQPQRSLSYSPLFQVMFVLQNAPRERVQLDDLGFEWLPSPGSTAKFDLTCCLSEVSGRLAGSLEYNTDLFEAPTIRRMAARYGVLLRGICDDPTAKVRDLPLLTEEEAHLVLVDWNDTAAPCPAQRTIHQMFEAQAGKRPEATAAVHEDRHFSYGELNARANQLAHHLRGLGVGPEVRVGICVRRGLDMVVGLLGILKAGGAYVPLDPGYPGERLAFMLHDADPKVLLTQEALLPELPQYAGQVLCLDRDWGRIGQCAQDKPIDLAGPDDLAYVIYTSGSTGRPKGVELCHGNATTFIAWCQQEFSAEEMRRVLASTSICFDLSVFELFTTLAMGGVVHVIDRITQQDLGSLGLTLVNTVPSAVDALLERGEFPARLRGLNVAGEALGAELVARVLEREPQLRVRNLYGPSEDTTYSTWCRQGRGEQVTIGRPIANTQIYILDGHLAPVPIGVAGELHIGGAGLARGYLNQPELTAEKFIRNPFNPQAGARLYKTGDLARYLPDGKIEYLGRIDNQVKLRGFRIELGEIESALLQHEGVAQAVVAVCEDEPGDKRLVAYVVGKAQRPVPPEDLRSHLGAKLPGYMVPAVYVPMERLPLTPNGKVDRKALPAPSGERALTQAYVAPRTETEMTLARIWAELLKVDQVGIHDDFFALGGHSLLATQVMARLRQNLGTDLPLRNLFEAPTVAGLGSRVAQAGQARPSEGAREGGIAPLARPCRLPASHAQQRLWFIEQMTPVRYHIPVTLELQGQVDEAALHQALQGLMQRHESLRTGLRMQEGELVQNVRPEIPVPLQWLNVSDPDVEPLLQGLAVQPFDLSQAPLWRVAALRSGPNLRLRMVFHHIIVDAWSVGVMIRDLARLYAQATQGVPAALPRLSVQHADYAAWERGRLLRADVLEGLLSYWQSQLQGLPPMLELPTDRARGARTSGRGGLFQTRLPTAMAAALERFCQQRGLTVFMGLLGALQILLFRYSGQTDLAVGVPVTSRQHAELDDVVGFFVNTLVLRGRLQGNPSVEDFLAQVRDTTLQAYAHQELPFDKLVEVLGPSRRMSHSPLFQVMFALQNAPRDLTSVDGLSLGLIDESAAAPAAKFDLTVTATADGQGMQLGFEYSADLFDAPRIEQMAGHYLVLIEAMLREPQVGVAMLPLLDETERRRMLVEWNATGTRAPAALVHERVAEQARLHADDVALLWQSQRWTYGRLESEANKLAHWLKSRGVGPESRVAVCLPRTPELIVALLGVLKAGGAYVPLDPQYPAQRLAFMLQDSAAALLLTQRDVAEAQPWMSGIPRVDLDAAENERPWSRQPASAPPLSAVGADHLAYVIYTSGSTGTPKGVAVTHRGIMGMLGAQQRAFGIGPGTRVLQFASISFDASVSEVFSALTVGACLILPASSADGLLAGLGEEHPEVATLPPALLAQIRPADLPSLKTVVSAGEALRPEVVQAWCEGTRLINAYGPTEATVCAAMSAPLGRARGDEMPPIGRPIDHTRLYIMDTWMQPVPVGVAGELYIGGAGLARGYLNRPALTAEAFLPDPFGDEPGGRLYRTGDLARYRPDGQIEYLGRLDQQVKVRGFRIELGEIESALLSCEGVREAVVVARGEGAQQQLVGYVGTGGQTLQAGALEQALSRWLPSHMVPSRLVAMQVLPLSPNGKVDRQRLPAPDATAVRTPGHAAPLTAQEVGMAALWSRVLAVDHVGRDDDFFERGGHSLLAVALIQAFSREQGVPVSVAALFRHSTLAAFTAHVQGLGGRTDDGLLTRIGRDTGAAGTPVVLFHALSGNALPYLTLAEELSAQHQVFAIERPDGSLLSEASIAGIAAGHAGLIGAAFPATQAIVLGGWSFGALIAMETARELLAREPQRRLSLLLIDPSPVDEAGRCVAAAATNDMIDVLMKAYPEQAQASPGLVRSCRLHLEALDTHRMERLQVPGLVLHSSENAGAANRAAWEGLMPSASRTVLEDADHQSILRDPATRAISRQLRDSPFAASIDPWPDRQDPRPTMHAHRTSTTMACCIDEPPPQAVAGVLHSVRASRPAAAHPTRPRSDGSAERVGTD